MIKSREDKPDAVGIDITVAPFVRWEEVMLFDVTDGGADTISLEVVAIDNMC
jgi:hypothetical protein